MDASGIEAAKVDIPFAQSLNRVGMEPPTRRLGGACQRGTSCTTPVSLLASITESSFGLTSMASAKSAGSICPAVDGQGAHAPALLFQLLRRLQDAGMLESRRSDRPGLLQPLSGTGCWLRSRRW
jgi:hypothetical protein